MEQLIKITTIPVEYELKISNAKVQRQRGNVQVEITREDGGFKMKSQHAKLNIDTYEGRSSFEPTISDAMAKYAEKGKSVARKVTAEYAADAKQLLKTKPGEGEQGLQSVIDQKVNARIRPDLFKIGFIPTARPEITFQPPELTVNYEMDQLEFDTKIDRGSFEFIPGSIELTITQRPDVVIEYIGTPMYVPPSAEEKFTGQEIDTLA